MNSKYLFLLIFLFLSLGFIDADKYSDRQVVAKTMHVLSHQKQNHNSMTPNFAIAIHGGAGTILKKNMTAARDSAYRKCLSDALQAGYDILKKGGTSLDAVEAAVKVMEDSPLFNAGKGAVFTADGKNEMDAAIMNGENLKAGAVAEVRTINNPISAARALMEKSSHVMLAVAGADQFAR